MVPDQVTRSGITTSNTDADQDLKYLYDDMIEILNTQKQLLKCSLFKYFVFGHVNQSVNYQYHQLIPAAVA